MKVTPEMLLFLAAAMNKNPLAVSTGNFTPHTDKAQFADVVLWAATCGVSTTIGRYSIHTEASGVPIADISHNSLPAGIMEATVVATCRALGWEDV